MGLREPREILIRFSLYQRMYESTTSMNCSMVVPTAVNTRNSLVKASFLPWSSFKQAALWPPPS